MTNTTIRESIVAAAFLMLLTLVLNPFGIWMPSMAHLAMLGVLLAFFGAFVAFVLRERAGDEREVMHRMLAGRNAFLAGTGVLIVGIVAGALRDKVDSWLAFTLATVVLVKLGTRIYTDLRR